MVLLSVTLVGVCTQSHAKLDGVPYITLDVSGKQYDVPIYNPDVRGVLHQVKQTLAGDQISREILLAGNERFEMFIGDGDVVRWLFITKDNEWVEEY